MFESCETLPVPTLSHFLVVHYPSSDIVFARTKRLAFAGKRALAYRCGAIHLTMYGDNMGGIQDHLRRRQIRNEGKLEKNVNCD